MDLEKLSQLARIEIPEGEKAKLAKDMESILGYVSEIKNAHGDLGSDNSRETDMLKNVMRADTDAHDSGLYTKRIVDEMPKSKDNYLEVKQIIEK
jgi:aspartyl/glutamyl-tRNA(Asn/Gln) amidotransferase C subunit